MNLTTAIVALLVLLVAILLIRRKQNTTEDRPPARRKIAATHSAAGTKYHAVSLKFKSSACEAAKAMDGKRFLSSAAPRIPLPECDFIECQCRFVHYKDRRTGEDRRERYGPSMGAGTDELPIENRIRRERREDPPDDF